jgi:hypothetical protein
MSRISDELSLDEPRDVAMAAVGRAVSHLGWEIAERQEYRIVPRLGLLGLSRRPMNIEVLVDGVGGGRSVVRIRGAIFGFGPIQKGRLRSKMNQLKAAILLTPG